MWADPVTVEYYTGGTTVAFDLSKAKKFMEAEGAGGPTDSAAFGPVPQLAPLVGPADGSRGAVPGAFSKLAGVLGRMDELSKGLGGILGKPPVRTFLGIPSELTLQLQRDRLASQQHAMYSVVGSRFSTAASAAAAARGRNPTWTGAAGGGVLLGAPRESARKWSALGPYGGRYPYISGRSDLSSAYADGLAANVGMGPLLAGTRGSTLSSIVGGLARPYDPLRSAIELSGLSGLGRFGTLVQNYFELTRRADRTVTRWSRFFELGLERARRAIEFYPRDSEGKLIPPWNVRLYILAQAAYYGDDYAAKARFLDEIGADRESADDVLFIHALLAPTFDPGRPDRRKEWWLLGYQAARGWLRRRLRARNFEAEREEETRLERQVFYTETKDPEDPFNKYNDVAKHVRVDSAEGRYFEDEGAAMLLQELAAVLPERQLAVVAELLEEQAHERRTYEQIGRELGMAPGTVKSHVFRVRNNEGVSEILRPDGPRSQKRPHRR